MANHLDKFLDQIQRQGIAVTLAVGASAVGYYIMEHHNREQLTMFKNHAAQLRDDKKILFDELLNCLKK